MVIRSLFPTKSTDICWYITYHKAVYDEASDHTPKGWLGTEARKFLLILMTHSRVFIQFTTYPPQLWTDLDYPWRLYWYVRVNSQLEIAASDTSGWLARLLKDINHKNKTRQKLAWADVISSCYHSNCLVFFIVLVENAELVFPILIPDFTLRQ